jgi:hypothetical protein
LHNIFLNIFFEKEKKNIPVLFRTLGLEKFEGVRTKSNQDEALKEFI